MIGKENGGRSVVLRGKEDSRKHSVGKRRAYKIIKMETHSIRRKIFKYFFFQALKNGHECNVSL